MAQGDEYVYNINLHVTLHVDSHGGGSMPSLDSESKDVFFGDLDRTKE